MYGITQHFNALRKGTARRVKLLLGFGGCCSLSEFYRSWPAEGNLFRGLCNCASAALFRRLHEPSTTTPWSAALLGDETATVQEKTTVASAVLLKRARDHDYYFTIRFRLLMGFRGLDDVLSPMVASICAKKMLVSLIARALMRNSSITEINLVARRSTGPISFGAYTAAIYNNEAQLQVDAQREVAASLLCPCTCRRCSDRSVRRPGAATTAWGTSLARFGCSGRRRSKLLEGDDGVRRHHGAFVTSRWAALPTPMQDEYVAEGLADCDRPPVGESIVSYEAFFPHPCVFHRSFSDGVPRRAQH